MYERILVPLDGSEVGESALAAIEELVSKLAPKVKVEVTVVRVISSLSHYVISGETSAQIPYTKQEMEHREKEIEGYLDKISANLRSNGAITKTKVAIGNATEEIIKLAQETKTDLVAMSTHGRSGFSRLAFGSVTDKILRSINTPVLVIKAPKEPKTT